MSHDTPDRFADLSTDGVEIVRLLLEGQRPPAGFGPSVDLDPEEAALRLAVAGLDDCPHHLTAMEPQT